MGARVEGLRARLVWQYASRGAFAPSAVERRVLCAAGQRGDGVGEHARRISYLSLCVGLSSGRHYALNKKVLYFVTRDHIAGSHIVRNALA